jgi:hypothetical protein
VLRIVLLISGLIVVNPLLAGEVSRFKSLYGELLAQYWRPAVTIHGIETTVFDYGLMKREAGPLIDEIVLSLKQINPSTLGDDNEAKAFWINVYNFAAMRMVVDAYPVDSITSFKISLIKHPWSKKSIQVGGRWYSLSEIEKEILLQRFTDPRIIFAVSCAAVSCPDRTAEIFDGARLEEQLDDMIKRFFRNPDKGLRLNQQANSLTLAWILKKDGHLFQDDEAGVAAFVMPYLDKAQRAWLTAHKVTIDYFVHDWTLNDLAQADADK